MRDIDAFQGFPTSTRYVGEFAERHNQRPMDTDAQMMRMVNGIQGKRLNYTGLAA